MASSDKNQFKTVKELRKVLAGSLPVDIIDAVASECNYDAQKSLTILLEMTNKIDGHDFNKKINKPKLKKTPNASPTKSVNHLHTSSSEHTIANKSKKAQEIDRTIHEIAKGYKVLVLLRGLPGCGKSHLAKCLTEATLGPGNNSTHILSTDDFFIQRDGYVFEPHRLSEAHEWNHRRAFDAMSRGVSPVIIDNTNMQMWEMKPYATMATDYGYIVEILEPDTWWALNDKELARRNVHNVPKAKIREMLDRFDKNVTPQKILSAYNLKYKFQKPPQFRLVPPLQRRAQNNYTSMKSESMFALNSNRNVPKAKSPTKSYETINLMDFTDDLGNSLKIQNSPTNGNGTSASKMSVDDILMCSDNNPEKVLQPFMDTNNKQRPYEHDIENAWGVDTKALNSWEIVTPISSDEPTFSTNQQDEAAPVTMRDSFTCVEPRDFNISSTNDHVPDEYTILYAKERDINAGQPTISYKIPKKIMIDKSSLTEEMSDKDDVSQIKALKDVFPKIPESYLAELYNKCKKNFDYTVDVLLEDKSGDVLDLDSVDDQNDLVVEESIKMETEEIAAVDEVPKGAVPKPKFISKSAVELKKEIEEKINIGNEHYSEHVLKVKQYKFGAVCNPAATTNDILRLTDDDDDEVDDESNCSEYDGNSKNLVELNLGETFVNQLDTLFSGDNAFPKGFQPVIQMPINLARQIYSLYIESICEQMDAQASILKELEHEDEEFARKLQKQEEANIISGRKIVPDLNEIMSEQAAQSIMQKESEEWKNMTADNLAARLTRRKLFDSFPTIDQTSLLEILHSNGNDYNRTVQDLIASIGVTPANTDHIQQPPLTLTTIQEMREAEKISSGVDKLEEAKPAWYYREEANKHIQQRQELYDKAKAYFHKGMTEVALFYSTLAKKETRLYDQANNIAAATFTEEHATRLQKFDTLDLHYLYVKEAVIQLDIFIDRNINLLQNGAKITQELFIITGRGKNSPGGLSKIRPAIISRLKKRNINFVQLNPGLLKIKVYKNSPTANDVTN